MAEELGGALPIASITGAVVVPLILSVGLFFGVQTSAGASAGQPINPAPGSDQSATLNALQALSDPAAYLKQNVGQLDTLLTQVTALKANVSKPNPPYTTLAADKRQQSLTLLDKAGLDITTLRAAATSGQSGKQDTAQDLFTVIGQINALLPVGGGTILDVPVVTQGHGDWCGLTSADMLMLYYAKGQLTGSLSDHYISQSNGYLVSKRIGHENSLDAGTIDSNSPHKDWDKVPIGNLGADKFFNLVKKSIDGKDPVIMYTYKAIYPEGTINNHIVVITGYDESNKSFIINNPRVAGKSGLGTIKNARTSLTNPPQLLTAQYLFDHRGELDSKDYNGHSLFIRRSYLTGV